LSIYTPSKEQKIIVGDELRTKVIFPLSGLDAGFGKLIVFDSIFFGFDHESTEDKGGKVFVDGFPGRYNGISFYHWGKGCNFVFPGEGEGFFEDFADVGPVVEIFEVGKLEFGGVGWHMSIIQ